MEGGGTGERDKGRKRKPPIRVARLRIRRTTRIIRVSLAKGEADRGSKEGSKEGAKDRGGRGEKVWRGEGLVGGSVGKVWRATAARHARRHAHQKRTPPPA